MVVRSIESFATRASTNSTRPIGGCRSPIIRFSTITRPKCTGSMPSWRHDRQQDRHQDRDRRGRLEEAADEQHQQIGQQQEHRRVVVQTAPSAAIISVARVAVSIQPKIEAAATISSTVDVVSMVSIDTLISIFQ